MINTYPAPKHSGLNLRQVKRGFIVINSINNALSPCEWAFNTIEEVAEWLVEYYNETKA
jgi:hypothetical protein